MPLDAVKAQWASYSAKREALAKTVDRSIWRVCRNILITESDAQAQELLDDPDGQFSFYFRYLRGLREMAAIRDMRAPTVETLNNFLNVKESIDQCVIAGSVETVTAQLVEMADYLGPFGTLVSVGHDWDDTDLWRNSIKQLATTIKPRLSQHMASLESTQ